MTVDRTNYPVLYVDDDHGNLVAIQYALEGGFRVDIAQSAEEALERIEASDYAVLLADHKMPGMTGVELCERVFATHPDMVRILFTAYADVNMAIDAVNRGRVMRYLVKPIRNEYLESALSQAIDFVHATRTVRDLQHTFLRSSADVPVHTMTREANSELAQHLETLDTWSKHLSDLTSASPERLPQLHDELRSSAGELTLCVSRLVEFQSRLAAGLPGRPPPPIVDLSRVVDASGRLVRGLIKARPGGQTQIVVSLGASPRVRMEPSEISHLVVQLMMNALQSVQDTGGEIHVQVEAGDGRATVSVQDDGPGVPDAEIASIFDPHFTTRPDRAGMGLAVASRLAADAGGALSYESPPSGGARFVLDLPLVSEGEET